MESGTQKKAPNNVDLKRSSGRYSPPRLRLQYTTERSDNQPASGAPTVERDVRQVHQPQKSSLLMLPSPHGKKNAPIKAAFVIL